MIKHILLGMMTLLVLSAVGCGEIPPATSPNSHPELTAFPAPCQTLPVGQAANSTLGIPDTGPASATPCGQIFFASDFIGSAILCVLPGDTK